jgi:hypothetical protein
MENLPTGTLNQVDRLSTGKARPYRQRTLGTDKNTANIFTGTAQPYGGIYRNSLFIL